MSRPDANEPARLPRCCPTHQDLATLTEHLVEEYGELPASAVLDTVWQAHLATDSLGLSVADRLETAETITRYQLEVVRRYQEEIAAAS